MKEIYEDIQRLNAFDRADADDRFCKLKEESGELTQAVNMFLGRKTKIGGVDAVVDLILEESADTIQCVISYIDSFGIKYEDMTELDFINTFKDERYRCFPSPKKLSEHILAISKHKGKLVEAYDDNRMREGINQNFQGGYAPGFKLITIAHATSIIKYVLEICGANGIVPGEVFSKISEKNIKWEKVATKRNDKK